MDKKTAIIIIAAGASSRLGQAKQLLPYKGQVLLRYMVQECIAAQIGNVFVVLGANAIRIQPKLVDLACTIIYNPKWQTGMGTSIACGITALEIEKYSGAVIVLGDQPFLRRDLLSKILKEQEKTQAPIVVCKYAIGMGPPSFFSEKLFSELSKLESDIGAKPLIKKYFQRVVSIDFEQGHIDIDTIEDLKWLS